MIARLALTYALATLTSVLATPHVWPSVNFVSEKFVAPRVEEISNGPTAPGYLFVSLVGNGTASPSPLILDGPDLIWSGPAGGWAYTDFHAKQYRTKPVISYWQGNATATFGHGYGRTVILDTHYEEVAIVCPPNLGIVTPNNLTYDCYLDQHESFITPRGTLLATAYNVTRADLTAVGGPSEGWIFDSIFYEIDIASGKVLFRWRSLDHLDRIPLQHSHYPLSLHGTTFGSEGSLPWDYFHINSVQPLVDGYLVNSRHLFTVYKVKLDGSVEWQLSGDGSGGDFKPEGDLFFSWQHRPRSLVPTPAAPGLLPVVLFNNDNSEAESGVNATVGIEVLLDLHHRTALVNRRLQVPSQPLFANSQGSYEALPNGHGLVGYGQICTTREFDGKGDLLYQATYGYSNATSLCASYRSFRSEWHAQPRSPPKVVVHKGRGYVSWNGATEVRSWQIYAGPSCHLVAATEPPQKKTGFENVFALVSAQDFVRVDALDVHGNVLGRSECVTAQ